MGGRKFPAQKWTYYLLAVRHSPPMKLKIKNNFLDDNGHPILDINTVANMNTNIFPT